MIALARPCSHISPAVAALPVERAVCSPQMFVVLAAFKQGAAAASVSALPFEEQHGPLWSDVWL